MTRESEHNKYKEAYKGTYGMGKARRLAAYDAIDRIDVRHSLLDVGCGRGEILSYAIEKGYLNVYGVDVVPDLFNENVSFGEAYSLPFADDAFDVVTCFDVVEHLLTEDTIESLKEFDRVAKHAVVISAANYPSYCNGVDLHINKRPYSEWDELIHAHIKGKVNWIDKTNRTHSETWVICKEERE